MITKTSGLGLFVCLFQSFGALLVVLKLLLPPKRCCFFFSCYLKSKVNLLRAPGAGASANFSPASTVTPGCHSVRFGCTSVACWFPELYEGWVLPAGRGELLQPPLKRLGEAAHDSQEKQALAREARARSKGPAVPLAVWWDAAPAPAPPLPRTQQPWGPRGPNPSAPRPNSSLPSYGEEFSPPLESGWGRGGRPDWQSGTWDFSFH